MAAHLVLNFVKKGETIAKLTIAAEGTGTYDVDGWDYFEDYIDREASDNIDWISTADSMNSDAPIQVLCGMDREYPAVLLLEETDYQLRMERLSDSLDNTRELEYLQKNGDMLKCSKSLFDDDKQKVCYYSLRSKSYVGKGFFNIFADREEIKIPFEMRSKKISYKDDYPRMLEDIAEFYTSVLFQSDSPVFSEYTVSDSKSVSLYEDFMILDHFFGKMDLVGMFESISQNRRSELKTSYEEVPAGAAAYIDTYSAELAVMNGYFDGSENMQFAVETRNEDDDDIPENRLIKDLLVNILGVIAQIGEQADSKNGKLDGSYLVTRLAYMKEEIQRMLSESWMSRIGALTSIPFNSSVLQRRHGYRELFVMYQMLGLGAVLSDGKFEELLEGHNKKVYAVYEYWCYIRLYQTLMDLSGDRTEKLLKPDKDGFEMSPKSEDIEFSIAVKNRYNVKVKLLYNKVFKKGDTDYPSYSLNLRPDFTLTVTLPDELGGTVGIVNFDAKYKISKTSIFDEVSNDDLQLDCSVDDIYKMHTYRDALLKSHGSYVLYPGDRVNWFEKDGDGTVIPSVGAIPLVPGRESDFELKGRVRAILTKIVDERLGEKPVV